ncbi:hypothetical protein CCR75_002524 [Bremia lactucae]|uniref:Uncharacterized protein n=1 Tax=Bremia lactucae TaxID=4779 RepID=A0A976II89_BRELC|nr:hypothetical protein CCR75_002524 [Bremia lactucae]
MRRRKLFIRLRAKTKSHNIFPGLDNMRTYSEDGQESVGVLMAMNSKTYTSVAWPPSVDVTLMDA